MRVNVYAEEMPDPPRVEIIKKTVNGQEFTGLRFYLELPCNPPTPDGLHQAESVSGPFIHQTTAEGVDDDSAAVTFWGKRDLRVAMRQALKLLDEHYGDADVGVSTPEQLAQWREDKVWALARFMAARQLIAGEVAEEDRPEEDAMCRDAEDEYDYDAALAKAGREFDDDLDDEEDADLVALPAPDDGNDRYDIALPNVTWTAATGNAISKMLVCYDPDTTAGTDEQFAWYEEAKHILAFLGV